MYFSLYLKGLCVRGIWRPNRTARYWPHHAYDHQRCVFLVLQGCSTGGLGAQLSAECWLSLPHLVTNGSSLQTSLLTDLLSSPSYTIVQSPTQYLPILAIGMCHFRCPWNGMFDCHQVEITVMQFTGHPLPVHQFVPWDFNPVPYCQPNSPMPMEYALPPSLEWHVWPGRRSIYNTISRRHTVYIYIIIIIISCWQHGYPWPSFATPPYRSSP